jgi:hypothetical protein
MSRISFLAVPVLAAVMLSAPASAQAQDVPADYQQVLSTLGKQGDFKDNVLKVNIPRNDVTVTVAGVETPTPFGFGGWVAMTKGDGGHQVLMGDLVLLQDEVNPVMSALLDNGLDVTALHNHFFWDEPRMFYMHVHGHGTAAELARKLKPAIDLIGKPGSGAPPPPGASQNPLDTSKLVGIVGTAGEQTGAVYKFTPAWGSIPGPRSPAPTRRPRSPGTSPCWRGKSCRSSRRCARTASTSSRFTTI